MTQAARDLILGTAGHIDHGKTSLVKALTGVDCDRLPEERERGITIDIGFAHLTLGDHNIGIVDVPGHERFIKNMLAGATGIDLALLVVAADDSVMPQTREHLEILQLLGLRHGIVVITKTDLVDDTMREIVEMEIAELTEGTFLEGAPLVHTSATKNIGIEELKEEIAKCCQKIEQRDEQQWFRLAIDRSFVVQGHGTVVTGSVNSGSVSVGDEVEWQPRGEKVRIRGLQSHGDSCEQVHRGQRAAINLAGVHHEDVQRGQEIATAQYLCPNRTLTGRLHCLRDSPRPLKHRLEVRFYVGTAEAMGRISLLDSDQLKPGEWGLAQFFLDEPITTTWGQPFVIRTSTATQTLGGGQILQPVARKIRRRHLEVLERVEQLWTSSAEERAKIVAWFAEFRGVQMADLVRDANVSASEVSPLLEKLKDQGELVELSLGTSRSRLLHRDVMQDLQHRVTKALEDLHKENPLMSTHERQKVRSKLAYVGEDALVEAALQHLITSGEIVGNQRRIARASFKPKLSNNQRKLKEKIVETYKATGFQPPEPANFTKQAGGNASNLQSLFEVCVAEGELVHLSDELYLHENAESEMRRLVLQGLQSGDGLTVAEIRDLLGTTRKYAVPFCEYLDGIGVTRREGDLRVAGTGS